MTAMNDTLDFLLEESTVISPPIVKKRRKVIGLDDLLEDYYKEKSKLVELESKRAQVKQSCDSDEENDVDAREAAFSECVAKCEEGMGQMSGDDETPMWGLDFFGYQKTLPRVEIPDIKSCKVLLSLKDSDLSSLVQIESGKEDIFLNGLLVRGWLSKLVRLSGRFEESIATWTFNLMLYSPTEHLGTSACEFWCAILQADQSRMIIDWLPTYSEFKKALHIYGFQLDSSIKISSDAKIDSSDSNLSGPPQNIRHWMKFVTVILSCAQRSNMQLILSIPEMEDLIIVIISLFLDRKLLGLSMMLDECMIATTNSFRDDEWSMSCSRVSKSIACRLPTDVNSLRVLESISGVDARGKQLRSSVAFQFLVSCFNEKEHDAEGILRLLMAINVKDKDCDLFKMYIYLNLAENWLLFDQNFKKKPVIREMWGVVLRTCSCLVSSSDMRPFASKVRNKASYLQATSFKYSEQQDFKDRC